ncbi:hypothetical protein [Vandammella animalimorsus]|uniref:hypothetical protein n=1 Tax=Vandammella animalimorsus TaxID=2029117 RepID=UPI002683549F
MQAALAAAAEAGLQRLAGRGGGGQAQPGRQGRQGVPGERLAGLQGLGVQQRRQQWPGGERQGGGAVQDALGLVGVAVAGGVVGVEVGRRYQGGDGVGAVVDEHHGPAHGPGLAHGCLQGLPGRLL